MSNLSHSPSADFIQIVLKGSGVLNQPEETIITLNADHHRMCKFSDSQDNNYRMISQRIQAEVSEFSNHEIIRAHEERVQALLRSAPSQHLDP